MGSQPDSTVEPERVEARAAGNRAELEFQLLPTRVDPPVRAGAASGHRPRSADL